MKTKPEPLQVVVLCGGKGTRLRPRTENIPKALVPIAGKPIIEHVIGAYSRQGVRHFLLCVGYLGQILQAYFKKQPQNHDITFSDLGQNASMLARLHAVRNQVGQTFIVAYGDTFTDLNLDDLLETHRRRRALVTLVTARIENPFGVVTLKADDKNLGRSITSFVEKPVFDYFIGCFVLEREALGYADADLLAQPEGNGLVRLFQHLIKGGHAAAYEHVGQNITFNTEPERQLAEIDLETFYTLREGDLGEP